jgi:hypothetical protein
MNVQELIDELNKIEDKTKAVKYWESYGDYFEIIYIREDVTFVDLIG